MDIQVFEAEFVGKKIQIQIIHMSKCYYFNISDNALDLSNIHYSVPSKFVEIV